MSAHGLEAFHFGFVVRDLDAVTSCIGARWAPTVACRNLDLSTLPCPDQPSDAWLRIAYGRAARHTSSRFRCSKDAQSTEFLEQQYGEGCSTSGSGVLTFGRQ
ncbi:MAG: hypothetical protein JO352_30625 [Chloroflexi bacterium]|nr:hypothetical protein [Chloroflexota bacterium]MBV9596141.1 hypothetical protein [Chloroflexota bacterium]